MNKKEEFKAFIIEKGDELIKRISKQYKEDDGPEPDDKESVYKEVIDFLTKNPKPEDDQIHKLAGQLGIEKDEFEEFVYSGFGALLSFGKSHGFKGTYDPKELAMGREVELEHLVGCSLPKSIQYLIAEKIARDHLSEIPDYYTRLKKMEQEAGIKD